MIIKVLKKLMLDKTWSEDGYKYTFTNISPWEGDEQTPNIEVNVQLPTPYQSYILRKMIDDSKKIISLID